MAQIVNRTTVPLEVYGVDGADGGALKRWTLGPGRQTAGTFDCIALRVAEGVNAEIFSSSGWWRSHTDLAFVYFREDDPFFPGGSENSFFSRELTLHCVPFLPGTPAGPPWQRGYKPAAPDAVRDATPLSDPTGLDRPPVHPRGPDEGELSPEPSMDFFFYDFGIQARSRVGSDLYISVRLTADPSWFLSPEERSRLEGTDGSGATQLERWKAKIERVWNDPSIPTASGDGARLHVECEWVEAGAHYNVDIVPGGGTVANLARDLVASSTMEWWRINLDDKGATADHYNVSAHEFGHYLGLDDGYVLAVERDYLYQDQRIKDLLDPSKATGSDAQVINNPNNVRRESGFWGTFGRLFTDAQDRAARRLQNGRDPAPPDLMDAVHHEENGLAVAHIDQELVDAIATRTLQPLYYRVVHFFTARTS